MANQFIRMARHILEIESDLTYKIPKDCTLNDYDIHIFKQGWGSTALGFSGFGGQMMTSAYTYVFIPVYLDNNCHVYFDGAYAYSVPYSQVFADDVFHQNM